MTRKSKQPSKLSQKETSLEIFLKKTTTEAVARLHEKKNEKEINRLLREAHKVLHSARWTEILLPSEEEKVREIISQLKKLKIIVLGKETISQPKGPRIIILEKEIIELTRLIEQQKAKIVQVPASLLAEKGLKKKLIRTHSRFVKAKKQRYFFSLTEEVKYYEIKREVLNKIGKEDMEEVQSILDECEELINLELELENKKLLMKEYNKREKEQIIEVYKNEDISFRQEVPHIVWQNFWRPK